MVQKIFSPALLLRIEGALQLGLCLMLYAQTGASWSLLILLFFVPDISIAGYLAGNNAGAIIYNLVHTDFFPALLAAYGIIGGNAFAISLALIWFAHIGFDRWLGFGLNYPTGFKDTHWGRI